ncbi:MAG: DNA polymerase III subunit delta' [Hyellaceae cyanobacterium CSU_1_1]|nr:DNA polymerase III subunit delta' [Hyellaceae cyanobacterium CSU_1_1]
MNAFENLLGQSRAVELLQQAIAKERIAPAYLFCGSSGIGRTIAAKNFTQLLLTNGLSPEKQHLACRKLHTGNHPDLLWVEPTFIKGNELYTAAQATEQGLQYKTPPKIRIEQIRQITQFLNRPVLEATRQVVIIEDAQTMAEAPANALLKTLEEPVNATLILIAPDPESLLTTLVSRCQRIQFNPLSLQDLSAILQKQNYEAILEHPEIIAIAQGSPGQAIVAWEQLQLIPDELLQQLKQVPKTPLEALNLAQAITTQLDSSAQLWLVDYLQSYYWQQNQQLKLMETWEKTRQYLLSYVQPRLVWECALLNLISDL